MLLTVLLFAFAFIGPAGTGSVQAKMTLGIKKFKITKGNRRRLRVKGTKRKVKWRSSNKAIVTVDQKGLVTALKGGKATVTAKIGSKKLRCKVYVRGLNRNRITMHKTLQYQLKVKNGSGSQWRSSDRSVAKVSNHGLVTALSSGAAYISCKSNGKTLKCKICVAKLNRTSLNLDQGNRYSLIRSGSGTSCSWSSDNNTVATVSKSGTVTGVAGGTATITCKCGSARLKCKVYVRGTNIVTPQKNLKATSESRYNVYINGAYGAVQYTIYNQSSSINKSKQKGKKKYMPYHGCATSSTATVLGGMLGMQITPVQMVENIERQVFSSESWTKNYSKSYRKQLPLSLNGITKIFSYYGISTKYVRTFTDSWARAEIIRHLKSGQPVIFVVSKKNRATGKKSNKWTNSYHTMAMLGVTDTGKVIVADSVNRSSRGSWQRIKLAGINEMVNYMFPCKKTKNTNYWGGSSSSGGYVLVYSKKNYTPDEKTDKQVVVEKPGENPAEDPSYIPDNSGDKVKANGLYDPEETDEPAAGMAPDVTDEEAGERNGY